MSNDHESSISPQAALLPTKLYIPPARIDLVQPPRLTDRLNEGLKGKLTLISAPARFGKTTLLGEWIPLSECELEILKLVAESLSKQEIGHKLFVPTTTVKRHINNVYAKLHVNSRSEAVIKAMQEKLP